MTLAIAAVIPSLTACGGDAVGEASFTDSLGNRVSLNSRPERVAVLFSSLTEMWTLAGGTVYASVGESLERGFCSEGTPLVHSDSGGAGKSVNAELLLAQRPDFVICTADYPAQQDLSALLRAAGIPVAYFRIDSFEDYLSVFKIMTDITGNSEAYESYGCALSESISRLLSSVPDGEHRILFARATKTHIKAKLPEDHFAADMLDKLGAYNIAKDARVLLDGISTEALISENPDYVFISVMGDEEDAIAYVESLFSRPEWQALDAVKNKKYIFLQKELFQYKPCSRWVEAYSVLYGYLYD